MKNGMLIDLDKCIGCQTCAVSCKMHNSLAPGQWWNRVFTQGSVAHQAAVGEGNNLQMEFLPVSCQMCDNAACEKVCPTQATYYDENGTVLVDYDKCIGCRYCMAACPYGVRQFNWSNPYDAKKKVWGAAEVAIPEKGLDEGVNEGVKSNATPSVTNHERESLIETACSLGCPNEQRDGKESHLVYTQNRPQGTVEKCTFCAQYTKNGEIPICVRACPAKARLYGDLDDKNSSIYKDISTGSTIRLRDDYGTEPKVYYLSSHQRKV